MKNIILHLHSPLIHMGNAYISPECIQLTNHTWKTLNNRPHHDILFKIKDKEPIIKFCYNDFIKQITAISRNAKIKPFCILSSVSLTVFLSVCIFKCCINLHSLCSVHWLKEKSSPFSGAQSRNTISCYSEYFKKLTNKL